MAPLLLEYALALRSAGASSSDILDRFLDYIREKKIELYSAQEEALLELYSNKHVVLNTPTGSGKSLVALGLHFLAFVQKRRSIYTCPIKALVNEKFLSLCKDFGPDQVGMMTGDASVNTEAPILCCTAEILANLSLRKGLDVGFDDIIMDEFHYYSDPDRGAAWQIPLIILKKSRFLLMSATMGEAAELKKELSLSTGLEVVTVSSTVRPVPLDYQYGEVPMHEAVTRLIDAKRFPIYVVSFTQRGCAEEAQNFMSLDLSSKEEKQKIQEAIAGVKFSSPYGNEIKKFIKHGYGIHHAGLLPKYRVLVESLAQKGLLKLIFGTDTLGVGVNVPIRTVLFTKLCKFDGRKTTLLSVRDFQQISGRAGRKGFDDLGTVVVQAPEHVIENLRQDQKAAGDSKKMKKVVKKKPPEKGFLLWNRETFDRLIHGTPEPLVSRFDVNHAMILQVLGRKSQTEDGCRALKEIIFSSHESPVSKKRLGRKAFQLFRSLVERQIIELNPLRVNLALQEDFSLNHALSLFLVDMVKAMDPNQESYALDVLTLVESILEDPDLVLRKQLDRIKTEKMREMKAEGVEYDQRLEELEKLEYPKPNRELIYDNFNAFVRLHPWVEQGTGQRNISPKSIAREMVENYYSFSEYIREYDLQRGEGILLRYLCDVYKAVVQSVPSAAKNEEFELIQEYLGTLVKSVDSSLIDEWEKLRNPAFVPAAATEESDSTVLRGFPHPSRNLKAFRVIVRNALFRVVRALASQDFETVLELCCRETEWTVQKLAQKMTFYFEDHSRVCTDAKARSPKHLHLEVKQDPIRVSQVLVDPEEHNDWIVQFEVNLSESLSRNDLVLKLCELGLIGS